MPINVSQAIDSDTGERIKIRRKTSGRFEDGEWIEGRPKIIKAMASVQMPTNEMIELFTGLERIKDLKAFYVNKPIVASTEYDDTESDILLWKDREYKAMKLGEWESYGFNLVIGARIL